MGCTAALWSQLDLPSGVEVCTGVLSEPDLDAQVDRLLDELPRRFALAGLSLGGIIAMALVRRAPERVSRLALMSTNPAAPTPAQYEGWQRLRRLLQSTSARVVQASLLPNLLSPAVIAGRRDLVELTLAMADEVGERTWDSQLRLQATRVDERPGLRDVRCPTLVLAGVDDALCEVGKHQEIAELVSGSRLTTIADCAHLSPLEQPGMVSAQLKRWLHATSTHAVGEE
jgi:pimeloyl-ACP methyl ester carboxylesterase